MHRIPFALALAVGAAAAGAAEPAPARRAELLHLVRQDCGACHGMTLKGGLGPSLEPAALAAKDTKVLSHVILDGRRGTPMPPWRSYLSEPEVQWLVEQLKRGLAQ
jgi:cytochrome c55X